MKKNLAFLCFILAIAVGGWWYASGQHAFTLTKISHETKVKDDFGDDVVKTEWEDTFVPGGMDIALPVGGGLVALGAGLLFLHARKKA